MNRQLTEARQLESKWRIEIERADNAGERLHYEELLAKATLERIKIEKQIDANRRFGSED